MPRLARARPGAAELAWLVPAVVICLLVADWVLTHLPGLSGDTVALVHGARTISYCLDHGIYQYCDRLARFVPGEGAAAAHRQIVEGAVAPYPLFQYLPALLLTQLGMGDVNVYKAFSVISLVAFCVLVLLAAWLASRTGRRWAPALVVVVLTTSPLVYYSWLTFGESLAALLIALVVTAALLRWPPVLLCLTAAVACLTKETVFPVIAVVGAASLWATPIARRPLGRSQWIGLASGVLVGVVVSAAFDWFRYGQLTNYTYGHSFEQVPGIVHRLALSVALWLAPNGGVGWFWPLGTIMVIGLVVIALHGASRMPARRRRSLPAAALVVALLFVTGTLASWFAPFGWVAWGPRLMMPALPGILLAAVVIYYREIERVLRMVLAGGGRGAVTAAVVVVVGLPQVNVLHAGQVVGQLFLPDVVCPTVASVAADPAYYYHCINHWAWDRHLILASTFQALGQSGGILFAAGFAAVWVYLLYLAIASLRLHRVHGEAQGVVASLTPEG